MNFFSLVFLYTIVTTVSDTAPLLDVDQERIQRDKFYSLFEAKILEDELKNPEKKRKKTRKITSLDDYNTMIVSIEEAYQKTRGRTQKEYYLVNKYEVYTVGDTKKIILKRKSPDDPVRYLVPYEQLFETIFRIHNQVRHKCRDIMLQSLEMITAFLNTCNHCIMNKKRNKTTGVV
ncbi:KRAB-A domain-containing 2-like, partial [Brachionus plicatilis]